MAAMGSCNSDVNDPTRKEPIAFIELAAPSSALRAPSPRWGEGVSLQSLSLVSKRLSLQAAPRPPPSTQRGEGARRADEGAADALPCSFSDLVRRWGHNPNRRSVLRPLTLPPKAPHPRTPPQAPASPSPPPPPKARRTRAAAATD